MESHASQTRTRRGNQPIALHDHSCPAHSKSGSPLPGDLRDWIQPWELISCLEHVVNELDLSAMPSQDLERERAYGQLSWGMKLTGSSFIGHRASPVRCGLPSLNCSRLFCLLGFSYSIGVFASHEIVRNCRSDNWFRNCSGGTIPFRNELVLFRRRHRARLEEILVRVFNQALACADPETLDSSELTQALFDEAKERLDFARHLDSCDE